MPWRLCSCELNTSRDLFYVSFAILKSDNVQSRFAGRAGPRFGSITSFQIKKNHLGGNMGNFGEVRLFCRRSLSKVGVSAYLPEILLISMRLQRSYHLRPDC